LIDEDLQLHVRMLSQWQCRL